MLGTESLTLRIPFVFEGHAQGPFAVTLLVLAMTAVVITLCAKWDEARTALKMFLLRSQ